MLGVTFFGLFLTPVFYVVIQQLVERRRRCDRDARRAAGRGGDPCVGTALAFCSALALAACASAPGYRPSRRAGAAGVPRDGARHAPPAELRRRRRPDTGARCVPVGSRANGGRDRGARLLARAGRHDARPADRRAAARQPRRAGGRGAGARARGRRAPRPRSTSRRPSPWPAATPGSGSRAPTFPIGGAAPFPDQDIWDGGFDASWELDLFGRVRRNVQAQGALVGAAERGPAGRAGVAHRRAGADLLRAARRAGAAGRGAAERARTSAARSR